VKIYGYCIFIKRPARLIKSARAYFAAVKRYWRLLIIARILLFAIIERPKNIRAFPNSCQFSVIKSCAGLISVTRRPLTFTYPRVPIAIRDLSKTLQNSSDITDRSHLNGSISITTGRGKFFAIVYGRVTWCGVSTARMTGQN